MDGERERLRALVAEVAGFYTTDRRLRKAQQRMADVLGRDRPPSPREVRRYLKELARYFKGFHREAYRHLADVEERLAKVSQVQFNLTAERGVAARRVELTQGVLERIAEIE